VKALQHCSHYYILKLKVIKKVKKSEQIILEPSLFKFGIKLVTSTKLIVIR